jgi:multidrug efflux pump subunit AcrA (membrane-fusion protein)
LDSERNSRSAPSAGRVLKLRIACGDQVTEDVELVKLDRDSADGK